MLFNSDGMSSEKWLHISPTIIPIEWIRPSQGYVSIQILRDIKIGRYKEAYGKDDFPHVVKQDNIYWLEDGHHRYIYDLLRGQQHIAVRILDNDRIV